MLSSCPHISMLCWYEMLSYLASAFLFALVFYNIHHLKLATFSWLVNAQEYISLGENRRRGSIDEDAGDYLYADYDAGNGLLVDRALAS